MKKNCVLYLVRSTQEDIDSLNKSLSLLQTNVIDSCKTKPDILLFHENSLSEFKEQILPLENIRFVEIEFSIPNVYSEDLKNSIPEFYPHPTHGKDGPHGESHLREHGYYHRGFTMGYRHMCRWFSGELYNHPIMALYEYYLRLDTDSFMHSKLSYDIFEWAKQNDCWYGYIQPGIQIDNPKVVENLWQSTKNWLKINKPKVYENIHNIPEGKMFYTNFEIGLVQWFKDSDYKQYYEWLDNSGGFYTKRWGDAPIKYLGVTLLMDPKHVKAVHGMTYQHGAVYHV